MKKAGILIVMLLACCITQTQAKDKEDFHTFSKAEKKLMLRDYADKNPTAFKKELDRVMARYDKLDDKEKGHYKWYLEECYYLLADAYALKGDRRNALAYLEKANCDYDDLLSDHDLDILRREPRFVSMLEKAKKANPDYLAVLKNMPKYNLAEKDRLPEFTYQSADDKDLTMLRTTYHLDSIAGKGNDISRMINLMEWVHYLVPHDGSKQNPKIKNALSLISVCKQDNKTLNCRGLAILLNEVYLAEGFKSRFVTCLPLDTADGDCHVINMVWSPSLKKWIWMDPTFMAYVMNEKGEMLGIEEVRDRLINGKPLILNPDANRNRAMSQTYNDYLGYYMTKNLYRLECPVNSQYNYETWEEGKPKAYIQLLPGGSKPANTIEKDKHGIATYSLYRTNNALAFWAPPTGVVRSVAGHTPAKSDYETVMVRFKRFYNQQQADSIDNMFESPEQTRSFINKKMLDDLTTQYGKMISFKYLAKDQGADDVALFKMVFDNSVHIMGISLDDNNRMGTFRFETSSPYIDKLLAKEL